MRIFVVICLGNFFLHLHHFQVHSTDDSFIFFRYVDMFSKGFGLRWNPSESPVEGYSSPLWLLCLIVGNYLSISPLLSSKIIGSISLLLIVFLLHIWEKHAQIDYWISPFLYTCMGSAYYWGLSGLETSLYALFFLCSFSAFVFPRFVYCAPLMALARPEGPILLVVWSVLWWWYQQEKRSHIWLVWIPVIFYGIFRFWYFSEWLPNTYYAKTGAPLLERILLGIEYTVPILMALVFLVIGFRKEKSLLTKSLICAVLAQTLVIILGGGDWMNWGRLLQPLFPIIIFLAIWLINKKQWISGVSVCFLLPFATPVRGFMAIFSGQTLPVEGFQEGGLHQISKEIAADIQANLAVGSTIAINHAGFIPYYLSEYNFVDMTGLNDSYIAHHASGGLHQKYDSDYVLKKNPDLIILNSLHLPQKEPFVLDYWIGETDLYRNPQFTINYQVVDGYYERIRFGGGKAYVLLFQKNQRTD